MGALQPYIEDCQRRGLKSASINHGLKVVRQILNLAAGEWVDEHGLTWLDRPPKIKLLAVRDARKPTTITRLEEKRFIGTLPAHLQGMFLFALNSGLRESELCDLRWEWEAEVSGLDGVTVFILPPENHKAGHKSGMERLVILNRVAQSIVEAQRGKHETHVFLFRGKPIQRIVNTAWDKAREVTGIDISAHSLRHTFGQRLRAAGVNFRDMQDLLGHKNQSVTAHYTKAEIANLIDAANAICDQDDRKPELTLVRKRSAA
jgi:integrase